MAKRTPKLSAQILEEASSWFIDFSEGDVDTAGREDFNAWLRRSPEHVRAYLQISAFWEDARVLNKRPDLDIAALIARATAEQNVYPLELGARTEVRSRHGNARKFPLALAAGVLLTAFVGVWIYTQRNTYTTEIGEQRSITLEDGSSIELNSRSRLKVRFTEDGRTVELLAGQALFRVAKNPARPFIVQTGDTRIRAVGTQFDVYRKKFGTVVTVLEGRVAVTAQKAKPSSAVDEAFPHSLSAREQRDSRGTPETPGAGTVHAQGPGLRLGEILLTAGEQVEIADANALMSKPANIAIATAWTERKLIFESTPLDEVVEEFNRYNRQQLVIRDPELYDYHVSGVFPSTDSSRMVEFLRQRFGVTMSRSGDEIEISRREGRNGGGTISEPANPAPSAP